MSLTDVFDFVIPWIVLLVLCSAVVNSIKLLFEHVKGTKQNGRFTVSVSLNSDFDSEPRRTARRDVPVEHGEATEIFAADSGDDGGGGDD